MKIVFAGTPDFSVAPLNALIQAGHTICATLTQPDRPAGRGRKLAASPVKKVSVEHEIPVLQPQTLKDAAIVQQLADYNADVMVVVAYGLILPQTVLALPRYGCLNIHASLLPRWRGAAPIQRAIEAGDAETGITIIQMDAGLDTGDMLLKKPLALAADICANELHDQLSVLGAAAIVEAIAMLPLAANQAQPQEHALATYAAKLSKAEATIDWHAPAAQIHAQIRAFNPWPVAQSQWGNSLFRIWESALPEASMDSTNSAKAPGTVLAATKDGIRVATGQGDLLLKRLQLPGGKPLSAEQLLNAHSIPEGSSFAPN